METIRQLWESYEEDSPRLSEAEDTKRLDEVVSAVLDAARDEDTLAALRGLAHQADVLGGLDGEFAEFLDGVLTPSPLVALADPERFRQHPVVGFTQDVMPARPALVLPVASFVSVDECTADTDMWSWFGGAPLALSDGFDWPARPDGTPLTHILQVDFETESANHPEYARTGLPDRGALQVFHDLVTYGEAAESERDAWRVTFQDVDDEARDRARVMAPPGGVHLPIPRTPINAEVVATVRSPLDAGLTDAEFARYQEVAEVLDWWPYSRNMLGSDPRLATDSDGSLLSPGDEGYLPVEPMSRIGGFGHCEANPDYLAVLQRMLPTGAGDEHVLLADINPGQFTEADWFHGGRHLEVWMRRSNLAALNFDDVWCMIRTDC